MENLEQINKKDYIFPFALFAIKIFIILIAVAIFFPSSIFSFNDKKILSIVDLDNNSKFKELKLNSLSEYNFLTKKQIYEIRKRHVKDSVFYNKTYEPNEIVFGQIVDNKPWWTVKPCSELNYEGDYRERIEGESKVSAFVNNPDALVGVSLTHSPWYLDENRDFCTGEYSKFVPYKLYYNKKDNVMVAKYDVPMSFTKLWSNVNGKSTRYLLQLTGINALDFGYRYVYAFDNKNIKMTQKDSITNEIKMFSDYIHLGSSCRYKDGCNNISPMQVDKMFTIYSIPAEINLKLWKERPLSKYLKADMYYKIIFEERNKVLN